MIEFKPCTDVQKLKEYCAQTSTEYAENIFAYTAVERGSEAGFGLFALTDEKVEVIYLPEDEYLVDVLSRSAMNYGDLRGVKKVNFEKANQQDKLKKLGFVTDERGPESDILSYINNCKNCGK